MVFIKAHDAPHHGVHTMRSLITFALFSLAACTTDVVEPTEEPTAATETSASDAVAESLTANAVAAWLNGDLVPVDEVPMASVGAPGSDIAVWTRAEDLDDYLAISVHDTGSGVDLGIGAMIVREVLDEDGRLAKVTVLTKAAYEVNPELGGWLFGVYNEVGEPLSDEDGLLVGALDSCTSCHLARTQDDFLFGMP